MPEFISDDPVGSVEYSKAHKIRTVSKGVNMKTGEGMRTEFSSFEEFESYAKALAAEDYDNELEL
jgi:hypothetical protein